MIGVDFAVHLASIEKHLFHKKGFHATSVVGVFSSALIYGYLNKFSKISLVNSIGIAGSFCSGNLSFLESAFESDQADRIERIVFEKLARIYEVSVVEFKYLIKDYKSMMCRLNHPSRNMVYAMSKGIFDKYMLYNFQDEYFKRMQAPNPLFLKRLDEIVENFD